VAQGDAGRVVGERAAVVGAAVADQLHHRGQLPRVDGVAAQSSHDPTHAMRFVRQE